MSGRSPMGPDVSDRAVTDGSPRPGDKWRHYADDIGAIHKGRPTRGGRGGVWQE